MFAKSWYGGGGGETVGGEEEEAEEEAEVNICFATLLLRAYGRKSHCLRVFIIASANIDVSLRCLCVFGSFVARFLIRSLLLFPWLDL